MLNKSVVHSTRRQLAFGFLQVKAYDRMAQSMMWLTKSLQRFVLSHAACNWSFREALAYRFGLGILINATLYAAARKYTLNFINVMAKQVSHCWTFMLPSGMSEIVK